MSKIALCIATMMLAGCAITESSTSPAEVQAAAERLRAEQLHQQRLAEKTAPYFPPQYDNTRRSHD